MVDWLKYSNQGATRNQPLNPELVQALSFLPELGVQMEVFSGGQDSEGPNRVGSHRHDHGGAADVQFYKDGRKLDWANPEDRPLFEEIVRRGKASGITGFGAGEGYMRPGSMHLGFGAPAVWGAGGSGDTAPDWLRMAYGDAPAGQAPSGGYQPSGTFDTQVAPQQVATNQLTPEPVQNALRLPNTQLDPRAFMRQPNALAMTPLVYERRNTLGSIA